MASLLRGGTAEVNGNGPEQVPDSLEAIDIPPAPHPLDPEVSAIKRVYQVSLIGADLLLLVYATWIATSKHVAFGLWEGALCVVAVAFGAWLACLAFWME